MPRFIVSIVIVVVLTLGSTIPQKALARTCLVLGGGGARGAAHIGVLKVLERERIRIDCITGTSMGAVVGGLYAAGYSAAEIESVMQRIDWKDVFRDDPARNELPMRRKDDELRFLGGVELGLRDGRIVLPRGLIQGQKMQLLLRRLLLSTMGNDNFDQLAIPFRSIATDIGTGQKVVFSDGDLAMAIRASMSVPAAFAPMRYRGRLMVDGGISDNVPIDEARRIGDGTNAQTRLIVVNVGEPLVGEDQLDSPFAIANQMLTTMMKRETDTQLATLSDHDVLITPDLGDIGSGDFHRAADAVVAGEIAANAAQTRLRQLSSSIDEYAAFQANHRQRAFDPPLIAFLDVVSGRSNSSSSVEQRLSNMVGKPFDADRVDSQIGRAYGEGSYERIAYELTERDGQTGLSVLPVDKGWGPNFIRLGLRLSDDFAGQNSYQLLGEVNFTGLNDRGAQSRNRIELGRITGLHTELLQPFGDRGQYYLAPYLDYRAFNFDLGDNTNNINFAQYRRRRALAAVDLGYTPNTTWRLSSTLAYGRDNAQLRVGAAADDASTTSNLGSIAFRVTHDSLDDSGFPSAGSRVDLTEEFQLSSLGASDSTNITRFRWDSAYALGSNRWLIGAQLNSSGGSDNVLAAYSSLGGLGNLSGFTENQLLATQTALSRVVYYRRLTDATRLISVPFYVGGSLEAGGIWNRRRDVDLDGVLAAGSVFVGVDTFLGPIFLGYGYAQGGNSAFYLNFGSLLRSEP